MNFTDLYLYPVPCNLSHSDYKDIKKKNLIWEVIAKELGESSK